MKAIILAGGEGTRLRPLSQLKPKPMIRLFDRPLLEHIVLLLRRCGYTELCMTLHYLPGVIRDYFGDGSDLGVSIEYRTETDAAGTAGSVLACSDFAGEEDFLVISGDAACSFDLAAMMEAHRRAGAEATILTRQSRSPGEFGLVLAGDDGRVLSFVEKPGPERVVTDRINTGIYVLSPHLLRDIPRGRSADFGGEIFPRWLRQKRRLYVWQGEGYWNDVGSCEAYLATCRDVLEGRFPLPVEEGKRVNASGPCWVSEKAQVAESARLGPYTVVGEGSRIGENCRVSGSVVDGAVLAAGCSVEDSILSRGVQLGREAQLEPGCVLAEGVSVGDGCRLRAGVRLWPGITLLPGGITTESLHSAREAVPLRFESGGILRGGAGHQLTPERMLRMGRGAGSGRVAAAAAGGGYARLLAEAFLIGAGESGAVTFLTDADLPASAAALGSIYGLDMSLFVCQDSECLLVSFFDGDGLPLSRKVQRKLEAALTGAAPHPTKPTPFRFLSGTEEAVITAALRGCGDLSGLRIACGSGLLTRAFLRAGAEPCPPEEGIPRFSLSDDGMSLDILDEEGRSHTWDMLLCALAAAELRSGEEAVVLPYDAPSLAERIAEAENGTVYRLERDGTDALRLFRLRPWCRDGLTLALRLTSLLYGSDKDFRFAGFMDTLPAYHRAEQVIKLKSPDTAVLRQLSAERDAETVNGVRLFRGESTATVRRLGGGELRILAESCRMEAAAELCESLRREISRMDGEG